MITPAKYVTSVKNKQITEQMLVDCLYSSNKRAKNYRDKAREYRVYFKYHRYAYDKYGNVDKCNEKKEEYYRQKEILLSVVKPTCIHKEHFGYERRRIYDYEADYKKNREKFVWENCFFDRDLGREVWFGDVPDYNKPIYNYYLFYDFNGAKSFHSPIKETDIEKYNLKVVDIGMIETEGHDIDELVSNQFVKKVIALISSGEYTYVPEKAAEAEKLVTN